MLKLFRKTNNKHPLSVLQMLLLQSMRSGEEMGLFKVIQTLADKVLHSHFKETAQTTLMNRCLTVQVADFAVLDCWKDTSKVWGPA